MRAAGFHEWEAGSVVCVTASLRFLFFSNCRVLIRVSGV